ncbi:chemotaxis protein CheW [Gynuella sunshinyii]|uniref:Chemotaxis signal transduction protein n=1 Tax=Gynuella sunshinyii YC6258 TaxID=1445510 RepID=A0A0C5VUY5_9GAMM|nr:chemotaxis protein CheW [Gynuella sunshinyii]AJQ97113.1 chemotaxis signal transduction protein [Gynuella sunshinyii YC6258]
MSQSVHQSDSKSRGDRQISADPSQFLTFQVNEEMFAIGILQIKEILEWGRITPVPMMPEFVCGVINLRGAVVPIIDLGARLNGRPSAIGKRTCVVILEVGGPDEHQCIGVMVDAVSEVTDIAETDIEPPPGFGVKLRADFLDGIGKVNGRFVILLNVHNVLSIEELAQICDRTHSRG